MEKVKISLPIIVEGRYDKSTLSGFVDATIITTGGFSIFNNKEKQLITEKLKGKAYKARSFFNGATPENGYAPSAPYTIIVSENPYSFDEENWATLYVTSSGADNARPIKLRKKPSTGQWFLNDIQCLAGIRVPVEEDPWA